MINSAGSQRTLWLLEVSLTLQQLWVILDYSD